jgi:cell wall-associated NlpC family hydrolase
MTIYVFRYAEIQENAFINVASELLGKTTYRRSAPREEAPRVTDCLTSIHYIFQCSMKINIPLTFIGDMPRALVAYSEWKFLKINIKDAKTGDVLFVKNKKNEKLLSHIAIMIEADKIFHCSHLFGTAIIQSKEDFFALYEQKLNFKKMVSYIDSRNKKLREEQKGIFIKTN